MKRPPDQLELPLFEPERPEPGTRQPHPQTQTRPVASSRCVTEAVAVDEDAAAASPSAVSALLTTREAAVLLHVCPRTIQRLVERGQLRAVHLGAAVRFDPADVAELTRQLKSRASPAPVSPGDRVRRGRARVSFADRLRSQRDEHRAA